MPAPRAPPGPGSPFAARHRPEMARRRARPEEGSTRSPERLRRALVEANRTRALIPRAKAALERAVHRAARGEAASPAEAPAKRALRPAAAAALESRPSGERSGPRARARAPAKDAVEPVGREKARLPRSRLAVRLAHRAEQPPDAPEAALPAGEAEVARAAQRPAGGRLGAAEEVARAALPEDAVPARSRAVGG